MSKVYRGVLIDDIFWFLVEDLISLKSDSQNRLTPINKLLNNISNKHKGFVNAVDSRGIMTNQKSIIEEIKLERKRQDSRFGNQPRNLMPTVYLAVLTEELGEVARSIIEGDSENYRIELIQLAAVSIAAIEEYDNGLAINEITSVCKPIQYKKDNEQNT